MKYTDGKKIWIAVAIFIPWTTPRAETKVERSPLEIGAYFDLGQVVKGKDWTVTPTADVSAMMLQRTGVYLNQITTVQERLIIKVGVGGLFFYGFPEKQDVPQSKSTRFGPGVGQAQGLYKYGDIENPSWQLQFGYFPYKYNPDAKNLGEYLFRCGTYPGYEVTGGYSILNSAGYMASGLRINGNFLGGKLKSDANIFIERDLEPNYDISPGLVFSYSPFSALELGAGAVFAHLLPVNPSKTRSKNWPARYVGDTLASSTDSVFSRFTFQGTKLMARASFNLGGIFNSPIIGKDGLKLYTEIALLGVKNYPYFYTDRMARIPFLFGLNLPTLNFFDVFAVEMEYRKWDFRNSTKLAFEESEPIWRIPDVDIRDTTDPTGAIISVPGLHLYNPSVSHDSAVRAAQAYLNSGATGYTNVVLNDPTQVSPNTKGNLKWTVYVKKQMAAGVNLYLQVASDHMRGITFDKNTLDVETITQEPNQWYYLFRLEFGI